MIAIDNFEMPEDCNECPCSSWVYDICTCKLTGRSFPEPKKRHKDCLLHDDGCNNCKFKYRCTRRPDGHAIIFNCFKFKREEADE